MIPLQAVSSRVSVAPEEISPASLMYTTCWRESQSNSLRRRCLRYPVLPFYGIPIMSIPSFEKRSVPRELWAFNSNRSKCGRPAILMEPSKLHRGGCGGPHRYRLSAHVSKPTASREFRRKKQAHPRWSAALADGGRSPFVLRTQHV